MYQFSGLIKCLSCGKNFKAKLERKKSVYICSGYANYSASFCERFVIEEDKLIYIVTQHLKLKGRRIESSLREHINVIEVMGRGKGYKVYYKDGENSVVNDNNEELGIKVKF
jgi:hypothetical protein